MNRGYTKSWRKIKEWGWYTDIPVCHLFQHLIREAAHKDKVWKGISEKRGQLITGRERLAVETGLSPQQVRTALKKLESTGDVTIKSTNKFSIITVCNYEQYQSDEERQQPALQPTINQQATTPKNVKNVKNKDKKIDDVRRHNGLYEEVIAYLNTVCNKSFRPHSDATVKLINGRVDDGYTVADIKRVIDAKAKDWLGDAKMDKFLRPSTLFNKTKFEDYLNEAPSSSRVVSFNIPEEYLQ